MPVGLGRRDVGELEAHLHAAESLMTGRLTPSVLGTDLHRVSVEMERSLAALHTIRGVGRRHGPELVDAQLVVASREIHEL